MKPPTEFGRAEAVALQAILESPSRPAGTMRYFEAAGFLFAVCCNPDMVRPQEWILEVLGESHGNLADLEEAQKAMDLLMRLYNHINEGVLEQRPALPWGCEPRENALADFEDDAPLSRWSRGFGEGFDWLKNSWPEDLPKDLDDGLGSCLLVLTFFSSRKLAEAYRDESGRSDYSLAQMAKRTHEMLPSAMAAFANLGRYLYECSIEGRPLKKARKRPVKKRASATRK